MHVQVVIPINNNTDAAAAGGSHWSLLCYLRTPPAHAAAAAASAAASCGRGRSTDDATAAASAASGEPGREGGVPGGAGERPEEAAAVFVHVDSSRGSNDAAVQRFLPAVRHLIGAPLSCPALVPVPEDRREVLPRLCKVLALCCVLHALRRQCCDRDPVMLPMTSCWGVQAACQCLYTLYIHNLIHVIGATSPLCCEGALVLLAAATLCLPDT